MHTSLHSTLPQITSSLNINFTTTQTRTVYLNTASLIHHNPPHTKYTTYTLQQHQLLQLRPTKEITNTELIYIARICYEI